MAVHVETTELFWYTTVFVFLFIGCFTHAPVQFIGSDWEGGYGKILNYTCAIHSLIFMSTLNFPTNELALSFSRCMTSQCCNNAICEARACVAVVFENKLPSAGVIQLHSMRLPLSRNWVTPGSTVRFVSSENLHRIMAIGIWSDIYWMSGVAWSIII